MEPKDELPPASAAPVVDVCAWCKEAVKTAYVGLNAKRYCSLGCQAQYEGEVRRAGPDWEQAAAATPAPVEQECTWIKIDEDWFKTSCNCESPWTDGPFCTHCGKRVQVANEGAR